ncbi:hypothetical protein ACJMK2_020113 [Sinanodonta woodiana]|uniref:Signal peptide, CUB and EGF-like domain-containing protein 1 n=1 Tax=Sinanodonta woodiana TaxID=1069815 RepID=A0ABD3U077_SINWO
MHFGRLSTARHLCLLALFLGSSLLTVARSNSKQKTGNECEKGTHSCHKDAICIDTRKSYKCKCKEGYYGNGKICIDDDECIFNNGGCVHDCKNSNGSYICSCKEGFELTIDRHNCIDRNECFENKGGCQHQCVNTLGSYECRCNAGYSLTADGRTCQLLTWCQQRLGCAQLCRTSGQSTVCACREGYFLHPNGKDCIQTCAHGNGGCQHNCTDTSNGPLCSCAPKYILTDDGKTCIASCEVHNGGCERRCTDIKNGTICSCPKGYKLHQDGRSCLDMDECEVDNGGCSHKCENNNGSYECICPNGYKVKVDQKTCEDINECELNTTCDHLCVNTPGNYFCSCYKGYDKYGLTHCADRDECSVNNGGCQHDCINTEGNYYCACPQGKKLHPNKKDCVGANVCLKLESPVETKMSCNIQGMEEVCILTCLKKSKFTSITDLQFATSCGPASNYEWTHDQSNLTLPGCSSSVAAPAITKKVKFEFTARRCRIRRSLKERLRKNITDTLNTEPSFKCNSECNLSSFDMQCDSPTKVVHNGVQLNGYLITVEFSLSRQPSDAKGKKRKCDVECLKNLTEKRLKKTLKVWRKVVNKEEFIIHFDSENFKIKKKSLKSPRGTNLTCESKYMLVGNVCVGCSAGTYYDNVKGLCMPCLPGYYSAAEADGHCLECPDNPVGIGIEGAKSLEECKVLCDPGTYSESGRKPCLPCAIGTYQSEYGRASCIQCGTGLVTQQEGSRAFVNCLPRENCHPGYFYNTSSHRCIECPIGYYQEKPDQNYCVKCPLGTITDFTASMNSSSCKNKQCGGYVGRFQGLIESPNYPGEYPNNVTCTWKIKPDKGRRILVIIPEAVIPKADKCGDSLIMRKSKSPYSRLTYETCETSDSPIAFTARSKRLWVQFKSDMQNTAKGFSIPFVTYNEEYQGLIEDIVKDGRLYSSYQHQSILKDRKLLNALMEVIAQPYIYFKYVNVSKTMIPHSFIKLLTPKVRRFFSTG